MPNTSNRNWPYPNRGKRPYFNEIKATFDAQDVDFQNLYDEVYASSQRRLKVINYVDNLATPPTEVSNDRYLLQNNGTSNAAWDGANGNDIVEFNGASWVAETPVEG